MALHLTLPHIRRQRPSPQAMTLAEHLGELRRRLVIAVLSFVVAAVVAFVVYPQILDLLKAPYCQVAAGHCQLYISSPLDGLSLRIKLATYAGLFFCSPVLFWEFWRFVTPALRKSEKRYAVPFVLASVVLFAGGVLLAYFAFAHALQWLGSIGGPSLREIYNPNNYLSLMVALMLVFGLTFEFPVLLVSLELIGVVSPAKLSSWRRWAIVLITVFAGVITPSSDPFSMLALAVPMYVFYEASIVIGKLLRR
jgi:sec-independent protein translocase protein TatC